MSNHIYPKYYRLNSMPINHFKEIANLYFFNYEQCPFCKTDLIYEPEKRDYDVYRHCRNGCYSSNKIAYDKNIVIMASVVTIFDHTFFFYPLNTKQNYRHYYFHNYSMFTCLIKRVENMINYYQRNDKYLIRIMGV